MTSIIKSILDVYHQIFPDIRLLSHEQLCLDAWRNSLSDKARGVLDAQLASAYLAQRQAMGAKVCFYYPDGKEMPLFDTLEPDVKVATVVLKASGGNAQQRMPVKIFIHRGRFFSIEFPKRPDRYWRQHSMQGHPLEVEGIEVHRIIDRA